MKHSFLILLCYSMLISPVQAMKHVHSDTVTQRTVKKSIKKHACCGLSAPKHTKTTNTVEPEVQIESPALSKIELSSATVALFFAIFNHNVAAVERSLAQGADVNAKDGNGWSPLHYAVNEIDFKCVDALLARTEIDEQSRTPQGFSALFILKERKKNIDGDRAQKCVRLIEYLSRNERPASHLFDVEDFAKTTS